MITRLVQWATEIHVKAACECGQTFIVIWSSVFGKALPWRSSKVMFCPFCGKDLDWDTLKAAENFSHSDD